MKAIDLFHTKRAPGTDSLALASTLTPARHRKCEIDARPAGRPAKRARERRTGAARCQFISARASGRAGELAKAATAARQSGQKFYLSPELEALSLAVCPPLARQASKSAGAKWTLAAGRRPPGRRMQAARLILRPPSRPAPICQRAASAAKAARARDSPLEISNIWPKQTGIDKKASSGAGSGHTEGPQPARLRGTDSAIINLARRAWRRGNNWSLLRAEFCRTCLKLVRRSEAL